MSIILAITGWTLFVLGIAVGLALDMVGLFGNWIILGVVAIAWALTGFQHFGVWSLFFMLLLATLGEVLEMLAAGYGASRFGGGRGATISSLVGCIVGAIIATPFFPLVGTLAGAIAGAFIAAVLFELLIANKTPGASLRTGVGAALGRIGGVFAKLAVGIAMLLIAALSY
ncbi:MAG: DUF456 domain-containing protein [Candidatus Hydrogenedentes bacterium]|nr:DUF456 domain-containing protein [Candidatus Hydrogenedentota bacterium]